MENQLTIPVATSRQISGTMRGELEEKLIIFIHGLGGNPHEHIFYNGARYMANAGFTTFRYNLYSGTPLVESSLESYAEELDAVIEYFRQSGVKRIAVIGHSYGGSTVLASNHKDYDMAVLWDAAHGNAFDRSEFEAIEGDRYIVKWNPHVVVGAKLYDEIWSTDWNAQGKDITTPTLVVCAGNGSLKKGGKIFFNNLDGEKSWHVVEGADHNFNTGESEQELFKITLDWLSSL